MLSSILLAAAALTGFVAAQNSSSTGYAASCYYSTSGPLAIDANCVDSSLRTTWCNSQSTICPMLCSNGQTASGGNTCDPGTLNYTCTCASGNQPNVSAYENTMAWHVCETWKQYCVVAHPNDLTGITACQSVQCGTMNASEASAGSAGSATTSASGSSSTSSSGSGGGSSSTASPTTSGGSSASGSGAAAATSSGAAAALSVGMQYGTGILGAGLLALFGFAL